MKKSKFKNWQVQVEINWNASHVEIYEVKAKTEQKAKDSAKALAEKQFNTTMLKTNWAKEMIS